MLGLRIWSFRGLALAVAIACAAAAPGAAAEEPASDPAAADLAADPAGGAIRFYQRYLSSLRHGRCRFTPSCSEYAAQCIRLHGVVEGSALAADRLVRCNAAAGRFYARADDGRLVDPAAAAEPPARRPPPAPEWLLAPLPSEPPWAGAASPRLSEVAGFAGSLSARGDCERAATEYLRAAYLEGSPAAQSWAQLRIGACHETAREWPLAERAFLLAGMQSPDSIERRAAVVHAARSRFELADYRSCDALLAADPTPDAGELGLRGLCSMARGSWDSAGTRLAAAMAQAGNPVQRRSLESLASGAARGPDLPSRNPGWSATLSALVPGTGQMVCGRSQEGFRHLLINGALIYSVVALARGGNVPAAVVVAGLEVPFYVGNVVGARNAARGYNRERRMELIQESLADAAPRTEPATQAVREAGR